MAYDMTVLCIDPVYSCWLIALLLAGPVGPASLTFILSGSVASIPVRAREATSEGSLEKSNNK